MIAWATNPKRSGTTWAYFPGGISLKWRWDPKGCRIIIDFWKGHRHWVLLYTYVAVICSAALQSWSGHMTLELAWAAWVAWVAWECNESFGHFGHSYVNMINIYIYNMAVCQNRVPLVNIKIAGKWMFIPLKNVSIGIDPFPYYTLFLI